MSKQFIIKPEKCVSCRTCELMCSFEHTNKFIPSLSSVTVFDYETVMTSTPIMCMQCEEACCLKVCPVEAIYRDEKGAVVINQDKCIVCKMCLSACPLGNISFSPTTKKVFKCDLCGGSPKCAEYCPTDAIQFVDPTESPDRKKAVAEHFKDVFGQEEL